MKKVLIVFSAVMLLLPSASRLPTAMRPTSSKPTARGVTALTADVSPPAALNPSRARAPPICSRNLKDQGRVLWRPTQAGHGKTSSSSFSDEQLKKLGRLCFHAVTERYLRPHSGSFPKGAALMFSVRDAPRRLLKEVLPTPARRSRSA